MSEEQGQEKTRRDLEDEELAVAKEREAAILKEYEAQDKAAAERAGTAEEAPAPAPAKKAASK